MDKRTHHMPNPSPQRLDREDACAIDRNPLPLHAVKSRAEAAADHRSKCRSEKRKADEE